ncbi:MAG: carboxypeptidase M32 [Planctomycetota bacterium]|jgi:carboxypeptidase Taq
MPANSSVKNALNRDYADLETRWAEIHDLEGANAILGWDQQVMMPAGGAEARANTLAALAGVVHAKRSRRSLLKLVDKLHARRKKLSPTERRGVELARHAVHKATRIPGGLAKELALAESRGLESWAKARAESDWKIFAPDLENMVKLKRRLAKLSAKTGPLYDALIDDFEPGGTTAMMDPLLDELKAFTVPLLKKVVKSGVKVDMKPLIGRFDVDAQRGFTKQIVTAMGIDLERGRLDLSTHPFCGGVAPGDVRMTSRYDDKDMRGGLFGAIHEAGHGLYEQGLRPERARTPVGGAISMAIHESQSRLWENQVARSLPFWKHWTPKLRRAHPRLKGLRADTIWRAANAVRPSMIRVEADELTYNLHIILRYGMERDLIAGKIDVADLPERWNDDMVALLGIRPKNDAEGVLQDIHWGMGIFGYFPTYSLGNLYAAQFMAAARKQVRGLDKQIEAGDMLPLRDWLGQNIHRHDQRYTAEQMVKRVTGKPLGVDDFARGMRKKVREIYGL